MSTSVEGKVNFTHLHLHTPEGSLLDGFCRIDPMIELAKKFGMDSIGISDHGTCFGHIKFYQACKKAGIHPVLGMEGYVTSKKEWRKADFEAVQYTDLRYLTKEELEGYDRYEKVKEQALDPEGNPIFLKNGNPKMVTVNKFVEHVPPAYPNHVKLEKKEAQSFTLSQPITDEHLMFLKTLEESDPERYSTFKKSTRWYLCGVKDDRQQRLFEWSPRIAHLLMIAKNNEGYKNLLKLTTIGHLEGFYGKPRVDYNDIKKYGKGIIASSSCLGGTIPLLIRKGRLKVAKNHIKFYQKCFDEFYLEIQPSTMPEQILVNEVLMEWSKELNIPLLATSDAHMLRPEELPIHKAITSISKGKEDDENDVSVYEHCMFYSAEEMLELGMPAEALQNAYEIAHKCHVDLDETEIKYPKYDVPEGHTFDSYLRELAEQGLMKRMFEGNFKGRNIYGTYKQYKDRLDYELRVIAQKGLSAYIVIVWDYINFAKSNGILVGPGRGSAAGSIVAYSLNITNLDPIKYNLLFERFINEERPGFPDIDTDFSYLRRHEVIEYVTEKYGAEQVAQICTFTTLSTKSALKDIGRALGIDHNEINEVNKYIPSHNGEVMPISDCLVEIPEVQALGEKYPKLMEYALEIESMPRSQSMHACFDGDTLITTNNGFKPIKDIVVGDKVLTHKKRFKEVVNTMVNPSNDIYKIVVNNTMPIEVTGNHPLYVRDYVSKKGYLNGKSTSWREYGEPKWLEVENLSVGKHFVGIAINQESLLPSSKLNLPFDNKSFWWIIGRYLGDGWTESYERSRGNTRWTEERVIICCEKHSSRELDEITRKLDGLFPYRWEEANTTFKIHIRSKELFKYLQQFGKYAHGKKITGDILNLPIKMLEELLNGYFSADGSFEPKTKRREFKTVSKELAHGLVACINKVYKRHCGICILPPKVEVIEGRKVFSKEKYDITFTYDKRAKEQSFYEDGYIWSRIKLIEKTEQEKDMYNLTVLNDSSYMANHIIAHNCGLLITSEPITNEVSLIRGKEEGDRVAAYDGPSLEKKGFIKFDFLG